MEEEAVNEESPQENDAPKLPKWAIVGKDVAEAEFERWAEAMGLTSKFDVSLLNKKAVEELEDAKGPVIRAIMAGNLTVNSLGQFVYTPISVGQDGKLGAVIFKEPKMVDIRDATKEDNKVESQALLMARMTGKPQTNLIHMHQRHSSVCKSIVGLFLG